MDIENIVEKLRGIVVDELKNNHILIGKNDTLIYTEEIADNVVSRVASQISSDIKKELKLEEKKYTNSDVCKILKLKAEYPEMWKNIERWFEQGTFGIVIGSVKKWKTENTEYSYIAIENKKMKGFDGKDISIWVSWSI